MVRCAHHLWLSSVRHTSAAETLQEYSEQVFFFLVFTGHAIFKLTYLSNHDYKHFYFESDAATVNEIVLKVSIKFSCDPKSWVFYHLLDMEVVKRCWK